MPVELRIFPDPIRMRIGERIHRNNVNEHPGELVIEAYGANGKFLPAVPVIVSTIDPQGAVDTRSDWDYFEAMREGEDELAVAWACAAPNGLPVEARVRILVAPGNAGSSGEAGERRQPTPGNGTR